MGSRIGMQTWGSDGDILPFLALAGGLAKAGHTVTVVCTSVDGKDYSHWGEAGGFRVVTVNGATVSDRNLYALTRFTDPLSELRALLGTCYEPLLEEMFAASDALCAENELVVGHVLCHTLLTASILHARPRAVLALSPMVLRTGTESPLGVDLGQVLNSMLWELGGAVMTRALFPRSNELRREKGLPALRSLLKELFSSSLLTMVACSKVLCPRLDDWGPNIHTIGFLNVPRMSDWQMSSGLAEFLREGPAPVYMTFGTCMQFDREENLRLLKEAAMLSGQRAIIQMDGQSEGSMGDGVYGVGRSDHARIFPLCSAIVHHGGAGTTQAAVMAGVPSVVVAHAYDQHDWGRRLFRSGAAPAPLRRRGLRANQLAERIRQAVGSDQMRARTAQLASSMKEEHGVEEAARLICGLVQQGG
jgi:sterol 3beta-glucosyltransferase